MLASEVPAQEERFTATVEVQEVLLDVLVTDDQGNVVLGLGPQDFVVEADGEPVPVRSVSFTAHRQLLALSSPSSNSSGKSSAAPAEELPRLFTLAFIRPSGARDPQRAIRFPLAGERGFRWAIEDLLPDDRIAAVSFDGLRLRIAHDFTTDRRRLGDALYLAALGQLPDHRWPSRTEAPEAGVSLAAHHGLETADPQGETLGAALGRLAEALGGVAGRKNLVLLGAEPPRPGSLRWQEEDWDLTVEALNAHNVAVYGLPVQRRGRSAGLDHLAAATGGWSFYRFDDLDGPLRQIARETSGYYLLSIEAPAATSEDDEGYRQLRVSTVQPQLNARSRGGFRNPPAKDPASGNEAR
ncbi:MAG: VWA domain-containing protein [Acidobacteriota bacterium]